VLLIVTLLIAQALAARRHGLPWLQRNCTCTDNFCEKCQFSVTTTPIDIKHSRCPAHGRHSSACKISPSYDAAFRRR